MTDELIQDADLLDETAAPEPETATEAPEPTPAAPPQPAPPDPGDFERKVNRAVRNAHETWEKELGAPREQVKQRLTAWSRIEQYGLTPEAIEQALMQDPQWSAHISQQRQRQAEPPRPAAVDPRIEALLEEREVERVSRAWQKEFGEEPSESDIERLKEMQAYYKEQYKANLPLSEIFKLDTREKAAKLAEQRVLKKLEANKKGKVLSGAAPSQVPTKLPANMPMRDKLRMAAAELPDSDFI
jgi:hypothetical protein